MRYKGFQLFWRGVCLFLLETAQHCCSPMGGPLLVAQPLPLLLFLFLMFFTS